MRYPKLNDGQTYEKQLGNVEYGKASAPAHAPCLHPCWQRHYWEHFIRDDADYQRHVDYVHVNSLKHGRLNRVADSPGGHKGLIPLFINMSRKVFIHQIGAVMSIPWWVAMNDIRPITLR